MPYPEREKKFCGCPDNEFFAEYGSPGFEVGPVVGLRSMCPDFLCERVRVIKWITRRGVVWRVAVAVVPSGSKTEPAEICRARP